MAAVGLLCLYLAVMSGHLLSSDGLRMWRLALALVYHGSWHFVPPVWWGGYLEAVNGLGASLEYFPGLLLFPWLAGHVPSSSIPVYDFRLLYEDVLYVVGGAPVWALITATTAYLVGLATRALGFTRGIALWAMAFYGLGSPALAASRGDWPQPLVALCWAAGVWACLRFNETARARWLWIGGVSIFYAVLTRPLEGSMLLPGVCLLLFSRGRRGFLMPAASQLASWAAAIVVTLGLNAVRFGSPLNPGYGGSQLQWTTPIWVGLPGALVSPGRGVLWEFPAIALAVVGTVYLWRSERKLAALVLAGLPATLLVESSLYVDWVGGWDWGFRLFQPALPLLAILAAIGITRLPARLRLGLPAGLLALGLVWNVPAVVTDLLGGYGQTYGVVAANWRLDAYPPIGAWSFLHHLFPTNGLDSGAVDIVWFRATRFVGPVALAPFAILVAAAVLMWGSALRAGRAPR